MSSRRNNGIAKNAASKSIACRRCHSRKVKCLGGYPCAGCREADCADECVYPSRDRQVKVKQSYLSELVEENRRLRERGSQDQSNDSRSVTAASIEPSRAASIASSENGESAHNPLLEDQTWFLPATFSDTPTQIHEAADPAFATRFRQALAGPSHTHLLRTQYFSEEQLESLEQIDCPWPNSSRARFLVKVCLSTVCKIYHIVRPSVVMDELDVAMSNLAGCSRVTQCKLWALFALGELHSTRTVVSGGAFPGILYFAQASKILRFVVERPEMGLVEVTLLLSYYSMSVHRRHSAYFLAGSAIRIAMILGMHLNIEESQLSGPLIREHRIRVWWTAYILDQMLGAKVGCPPSVIDDEIEVSLPSDNNLINTARTDFEDSQYIAADIQLVRLSQEIIRSLYKRKNQHGNFLQRVQSALKSLRNWIDSLPSHLQINAEDHLQPTPSRTMLLHLSFNQCIIVATRPVLLHLLRAQKTSQENAPSDSISEPTITLAEACIRCARHSFNLLTESWINGTFSTFEYANSNFLFSTATVLAVASCLRTIDWKNDRERFETASDILGQLANNGHFGAMEFCRQFDAMKHTMATSNLPCQSQVSQVAQDICLPSNQSVSASNDVSAAESAIAGGLLHTESTLTGGMVLAQPTLQEFLALPEFDLQFDTANMGNEGLESMYLS